ncbi:MAG: pilus (MSHA type) biogenesis protein MshL [Comamonadaceae bacterium]|nr:MAG: pilus (MSHA type) biogenesis protein MshL [Comamonadaceae bacterium]
MKTSRACQTRLPAMLRIVAGIFSALLLCACTVPARRPQPAYDLPKLATTTENAVVDGSAQLAQANDALSIRLDRKISAVVHDAAPVPDDPLSRKTVSLSMQNARVGQLLWPLSNEFGISLSIEPAVLDMQQVSNLHLQKVTGRQALNHILAMYDLAGTLGPDNVLVVGMMEEKTFDIEILAGKTSINVGVGGDVFGSSSKEAGVKDSLSLAGDFGEKSDGVDHLVKSIEAILAEDQGGKDTGREKSRYTVDRSGGILYVRARPSRMRAVEKFISQGKVFRGRQVQIDAQLVDVQLSDSSQLGIDWNLLGRRVVGRFGAGAATLGALPGGSLSGGGSLNSRVVTLPAQAVGNANGTGGGIGFGNNSFSVALNALRTFGTVKLLSNPTVRVRNGVPAYLSVGNNIRYIQKITASINNQSGGASTTSMDVETSSLFSGVVLGVSALVKNDGFIELFVRPSQTQVQSKSLDPIDVGAGNKVSLPVVNTKSITTNLNIRDGDTIVIGGLIDQQLEDTDQDVPGVSDIPLLGRAFGNNSRGRQTRELVVVLRARVLPNAD